MVKYEANYSESGTVANVHDRPTRCKRGLAAKNWHCDGILPTFIQLDRKYDTPVTLKNADR